MDNELTSEIVNKKSKREFFKPQYWIIPLIIRSTAMRRIL
jgi:hypothetical protein